MLPVATSQVNRANNRSEGKKSEALEEAQKPHGVKNRWLALSKTARIAIICGVVGGVVIMLLAIAFCCIRQRRAGRREFAAFQAEQNKEAADLLHHRQEWASTHQSSNYRRI